MGASSAQAMRARARHHYGEAARLAEDAARKAEARGDAKAARSFRQQASGLRRAARK